MTSHRLDFLTEIIRLLLTMVPDQRGAVLKEEEVPYRVTNEVFDSENVSLPEALLRDVPFVEKENVKRET